jgi:16S rRNA (guanine966-N2)-methyltransferase
VRIIGGAFRGRRLASLGKGDAGAHLRPTADRVRESLFNVLTSRFGDPCSGAQVLDLFAGTGALGLEALSRGASRVVFVENGRTALGLLRQNIALCDVSDRACILQRDARKIGACPGAAATLVFLDPPYGKALGEAALAAALAGGWIAPGAWIVWEEHAAVTPPAALALCDERRYGDTVIRIFEYA